MNWTIRNQVKKVIVKLTFIGLAATLFVFQLDATCLGIALPVSYNTPDLDAVHIARAKCSKGTVDALNTPRRAKYRPAFEKGPGVC
jgi:hypothetical protein